MSLTKATYSMIEGAPANVLDYGAVGDGVANDTAAFTAALAAASAVYVPQGTFAVENLSVPNGKTLTGSGAASILKIVGGSANAVINMASKDDWTISNLTLDADATGTVIAQFVTCNRGKIENVWATGSTVHGIDLNNCSRCTIDNVEVYSTGGNSACAAIYLKNFVADGSFNRVSNVIFRDINGRGIHIIGNNYTQVDTINGLMTNGEMLLIEEATGCVCTNLVMAGSEPGAAALSDGLAINGGSFYNTISGFHVSLNSGHGVSINGQTGQTGASYNTVANGTVVNADEGGVIITDQGVVGSVPVGNTVSNVVVENAGRGITSESFGVSGGTDNIFVNCISKDSQGSPTTTFGFSEVNGANTAARNNFSGHFLGTYTAGNFNITASTSAAHSTRAATTDTWVVFDGATGATATIKNSRNVATVVRNSAGNYTISAAEPIEVNCMITAIARAFAGNNYVQIDTAPIPNAVTIQVRTDAGTPNDSDYICVRMG